MRIAILVFAMALAGCNNRDPRFHGTINGPLSGDQAISQQASGGERLTDLGQEGVRALIAPSFGRYAYYLSLRRLPVGCLPRDRQPSDGSALSRSCGPSSVYVRRVDQSDKSAVAVRFFLPPEESDMLFEKLDARLDHWRGLNLGGTDGTGVDLERVRDGRITSMWSNSSVVELDNPAAQLSGDLHRILLAYGPSGFAPRSYDWNVRHKDDVEDPCNTPAVAISLAQGFGVGDSDCDAADRWSQVTRLPSPGNPAMPGT